ncbi:MAG: hypothetical protein O9272_14895 [Brevundimonas sp.]|nr:hypothetical protein [Brevundimonas sp.]
MVDALGSQVPLQRIYLGSGLHKEKWLQELIHVHPNILPVSEIEPGFGSLIPAALEVSCSNGRIDNLFLTPSGDIVFVETKLWRNTEMRREVVAQVLDYVSALTAMSYDEFQAIVSKGEKAPKRLYDLVADNPEALPEAEFVDAVSSNLRRGRMLAIVLGDGIRSETEALAALLQSHAGAHFTFALVELATWQTNDGSILAIPSTLAKTIMIERGIVRIENGIANVDPIPPEAKARAQSISMGDFMAEMAERDPKLPDAINTLIDALKPLGVYPELKQTLNLKVDLPELDKPLNFGYIDKQGKFWSNPAAWNTPEAIWRPYFETLSALIGGHVIDEPGNRYVAISGRSAPRITDLLPQHLDAWVAAIEATTRRANEMGEAN